MILVATSALELAGVREQQARLPEQIQRNIRQRQVLFEHRRMPAPFREPLAEDEGAVGEAEDVFEVRSHD